MIFAHIDENNMLLGWYDDTIHTNIPEPNIEVSKENWLISISKNANKINFDGTSEVVKIKSQIERQDEIILSPMEYLKSTDWYYFRLLEEQIPIPEEIVEKRIQARKSLNP